jgi:hypothetical protein
VEERPGSLQKEGSTGSALVLRRMLMRAHRRSHMDEKDLEGMFVVELLPTLATSMVSSALF